MINQEETIAGLTKRSEDLFKLCDEWVAGRVGNQDFQFRFINVMFGRPTIEKAIVMEKDGVRENLLQTFRHAVRCSLAVSTAMTQIQKLGDSTEATPLVRGYFFGKNLVGNDNSAFASLPYCNPS